MSKLDEVGKLTSVLCDTATGEVSVVFKVIDPEYKEFVFRWAHQVDGRFVIRGEQLLVDNETSPMRSSGRREKDADV